MTWGHGVFWRRFNGRRRFTLVGSDIRAMDGVGLVADFRCLPYADASLDIVAFDPPYVHVGKTHFLDHRYGNAATTAGCTHADIIALYQAGLIEAWRVLRVGGQVWVKCQDEIESGRQQRSSWEIYQHAIALGFADKDQLILVPRPISTRRHHRQLHARKAHSYLWIFRKPRLGARTTNPSSVGNGALGYQKKQGKRT